MLLLGKRLDYTLKFGKPPTFGEHCTFVQIDADAEEITRSRRAVGTRLVASTLASPLAAVETLTRRANATAAKSAWCDEVRAAIAYRPDGWTAATSRQNGRLHPLQVLLPLQAVLDEQPDSVLILDGGEFAQWAQACLAAPNRVSNGVAGAIGAGLPFAVAARLAKPDGPVIADESYRTICNPVSNPFTTSWKNSTIAYAVQNALRVIRRVRSTNRSSEIAATTASRAAVV